MSHKNTILVEIPKNFMNCDVTIDNYFVSDTNNSSDMHTLKFPLPTPKGSWEVGNIEPKKNKNIVSLVDSVSLKNKLFDIENTLGGYTKEEWKDMVEDGVVGDPSEEVLKFINQ